MSDDRLGSAEMGIAVLSIIHVVASGLGLVALMSGSPWVEGSAAVGLAVILLGWLFVGYYGLTK